MATTEQSTDPWDREYQGKGIPSSYKADPSTSVEWLLDMARYIRPGWQPNDAIDIGCGTGRNSLWLAQRGLSVVAIERSGVAVELVQKAISESGITLDVRHHDLTNGLPVGDESADIAIDTFVSFHVVERGQRAKYIEELARILRPGGLLLLTLATADDGFYAYCPEVDGWSDWSDLPVVEDPDAKVMNVLPTESQVIDEFGAALELVATWRKSAVNVMHGRQFDRFTFCSIWKRP